LLRHYYDKKL